MLTLFRKTMLQALLRRAAVALAAVLVAWGVQGDQIDFIVNGVVASGLVAFDVVMGLILKNADH